LRVDSPVGGECTLTGMSSSLAIGDFSRATHLTVKTLRHYHESRARRTAAAIARITVPLRL
jgi:hypothetical protein